MWMPPRHSFSLGLPMVRKRGVHSSPTQGEVVEGRCGGGYQVQINEGSLLTLAAAPCAIMNAPATARTASRCAPRRSRTAMTTESRDFVKITSGRVTAERFSRL